MSQQIVWGDDLPGWTLFVAALILGVYVVRALVDAAKPASRGRWVSLLDIPAGLVVFGAMLRPTWVTAQSTPLGQSVAVLVDSSRRLQVKSGATTRAQDALKAMQNIQARFAETRLSFFEFGRGPLRPIRNDGRRIREDDDAFDASGQSDLTLALDQLREQLGEKPAAVIVVSDGRLSRPDGTSESSGFRVPNALRGTVVHAVDVGGNAPADASILAVETSGNAVAHQSFAIDIVVGCFGGLACSRVPVVVREHKKGVPPSVLASADADFSGKDVAHISLELTLERAGTRVIEVAIAAPDGDEVPENNSRMVTFRVLRDRLRLLHVAGRPTYDVRALRNWLKSDASVDLVSFFILRTDGDDTNTEEDSELALIPFPVDELFSQHLPSFDAVLLGDIDAERYQLSRYLGNLSRYVEQGGGLILIGGPSAYTGGGYASTPLDRVLPVTLVNSERPFDTVEFVPSWTSAGRQAAMMAPLRGLLGERLPSMPGANSLGIARSRAVVLWEHPNRRVLPVKTGGAPREMPVLAVTEAGDGRVVALGVDGTHRLAFGQDAVKDGGRAYGALWDGLLGWVIRDPRFDATHGELLGECIAGEKARARIDWGVRTAGELVVEIEHLDVASGDRVVRALAVKDEKSVDVDLGSLPAGAYSALARIGDGPGTRFDFACEAGGTAMADTRPDPDRLAILAKVNGGRKVDRFEIDRLPIPAQTVIHGARQSRPLLRAWQWALLASSCLGINWLLRRLNGLT
jgi:uncharacterized membrane protein